MTNDYPHWVPESQTFADWLRERMHALGHSQESLSDLLGVSRQAIAGWLRGAHPQRGHEERTRQRLAEPTETAFAPLPASISPEEAASFAVNYQAALKRASAQYDPIVAAYEELLKDSKARARFARDRLRELSRRWRQHMVEIRNCLTENENKIDLTSSANISKRRAMQMESVPTLEELLTEVRSLTAKSGAKKALADSLAIKQAQLSRWLSLREGVGRYAPSAANALKLFNWVIAERQAQQKKNPEEADTPSGSVTQQRKSSHEKPEPGRSKSSRKRGKKATPKR